VRKVKGTLRGIVVFPMTLKGYQLGRAKDWWLSKRCDLQENKELSFRKKKWAHRRGFLGNYVAYTGIDASNYKNFISEKKYHYIQPINSKYNKWLNDQVSVTRVYKPFDHLFPQMHYHFYVRDGKWKVFADSEEAKKHAETEEGILEFIRLKGKINLSPTHLDRPVVISYVNDTYFLNHEEINEKMLKAFIFRKPGSGFYRDSTIMITEPVLENEDFCDEKAFCGHRLQLYILNSEGDNPKIGDAFLIERKMGRRFMTYYDELKLEELYAVKLGADKLPKEMKEAIKQLEEEEGFRLLNWHRVNAVSGEIAGQKNKAIPFYDELKTEIKKICLYTPQIEFFAMSVVMTEDGFKIEEMQDIPPFPKQHLFSEEVNEYLLKRVQEKVTVFRKPSTLISHSWKRVVLQVRKRFARAFFPETLYPYLSIRTIQECTNDFFTNKEAGFREKLWAYKHGFQSYRLSQYGITRKNHEEFISDFEYKWLRHINGKYRTWFEDKVTIKYILRDFKECFPNYYYFTAVKNGNSKIIPLMDCPEGYEASYEDIFRLVEEKKMLALKPDEGSHGEGFFKFTYADDSYYLNDEEVSKERVMELFKDVDNQYLITEFIQMHPEIAKIYPGSVNTVRLTVFKKDGITPYIGNGYMRYGTAETGGVDNIGAGGIGVDVNVETGFFYNPVKLKDGAILVPCEYHPDTGEKIEGYLPNWEYVRETILKIATAVPEMEYFGFDLAITEDGIKFPEINRFPDYPRINKLTPETIDYLLYKLDAKRSEYGYNRKKPPWRLVNLPKRRKR